jgi:two-component system response regulator YesN
MKLTISTPKPAPENPELVHLTGLVSTLDWILDGKTFNEILNLLPFTRMSREKLTAFFYQPVLRASEYIKMGANDYFNNTQNLRWWFEWKLWLLGIRENLQDYMNADSAAIHRLHRALIYTKAHFLENLHVDDVIKEAGMSKSYFSSIFKEVTGQTFIDYLKNLRLDYAKRLLTETGRPISQVGEDAGYPDDRYFRRLFVKMTGCSPIQYRNEHRHSAAKPQGKTK